MKESGLIQVTWPEFGTDVKLVEISLNELEKRLLKTRRKMEEGNLTHLVVYGDREHFANLLYLINFDPRFEEALLMIDLKNDPLILVGNECKAHLTASPLFNAGKLRYELYQPFSLLNQPKMDSRYLNEIFLSEGMNSKSRIGCAGWKYFSEQEHPDAEHAIDIPGYITDTLRKVSTFANVVNCNDLFMHPGYGLRAKCSSSEIALFEFSNVMASEGMKNLIFNIREGMTDFELVRHYNYSGYPLNCHIRYEMRRE